MLDTHQRISTNYYVIAVIILQLVFVARHWVNPIALCIGTTSASLPRVLIDLKTNVFGIAFLYTVGLVGGRHPITDNVGLIARKLGLQENWVSEMPY